MKTYASLGFVTELRYVEKGGEEYEFSFKPKSTWTTKTGKDSYLMISNNNKEIILTKWKAPKSARVPSGAAKSKRLQSQWSGYDVEQAYKVNLPTTALEMIGHARRIEYNSDKFERRGDKRFKFHGYKHIFKGKVRLYSNKSNTVFVIRSSKPLWNSRGIIG